MTGLVPCPGQDGLACPDGAWTLNGRICRACIKGLAKADPDPGEDRAHDFTDRPKRRRNPEQRSQR